MGVGRVVGRVVQARSALAARLALRRWCRQGRHHHHRARKRLGRPAPVCIAVRASRPTQGDAVTATDTANIRAERSPSACTVARPWEEEQLVAGGLAAREIGKSF